MSGLAFISYWPKSWMESACLMNTSITRQNYAGDAPRVTNGKRCHRALTVAIGAKSAGTKDKGARKQKILKQPINWLKQKVGNACLRNTPTIEPG
jgi:hypothetical protein